MKNTQYRQENNEQSTQNTSFGNFSSIAWSSCSSSV